MRDKMAISAYILKIVEKDPFLRLQMKSKETFNRHQFLIFAKIKAKTDFAKFLKVFIKSRNLNISQK